MQWHDQMGNQYKLRFCFFSVSLLKFGGKYWEPDGSASGVVVEVKTWLGDKFFTKPENVLFSRHAIEARNDRISDRMKSKMRLEPCDCGCNAMKPADEWSAAWNQAASMVRCEPI